MEAGGIDDAIRAEITRRLKRAEDEHSIRVIYACESGSRAWGFASPDSDFDVRFLYCRGHDWYLSFDIERRRDVVEYAIVDEIDCSGWDLRKALSLFMRSNGALLEWLNSPIVYIEQGDTAKRLRQLGRETANLVALAHHYGHAARMNAREHVMGDTVRLKKYFYVLRPLLAIRFIEQFGGIPPVAFRELVDQVAPEELRTKIAQLVQRKREMPELGVGPAIPELSAFIKSEFERHKTLLSSLDRPELPDNEQTRARLNQIFRDAVAGFS